MRWTPHSPTTFLSSVATKRRFAGLDRASRGSCGRISRRSRGRGIVDQLDKARCASRRLRGTKLGWARRFGLRLRRWALNLGRGFRLRFGVVRGAVFLAAELALARQHGDVERRAPVLRAEIAEIMLDVFGCSRSGPSASIPNTALPPTGRSARPCRSGACPAVRTRDRTSLRPRLRAASASCVDARIAHSVSSAWRMRPTRPPTRVPLIRIYCRSRPTAASSRSVTVRASQPRTVSDTSLTIEPP